MTQNRSMLACGNLTPTKNRITNNKQRNKKNKTLVKIKSAKRKTV
jgi:hypothetical protein